MDIEYQKICIDCERENVNFYAQEIGFFSGILERAENEVIRQWCDYFITFSEQELENASERLKDLREELTAFELRQAVVQ